MFSEPLLKRQKVVGQLASLPDAESIVQIFSSLDEESLLACLEEAKRELVC
jgi:hypothetical protein